MSLRGIALVSKDALPTVEIARIRSWWIPSAVAISKISLFTKRPGDLIKTKSEKIDSFDKLKHNIFISPPEQEL